MLDLRPRTLRILLFSLGLFAAGDVTNAFAEQVLIAVGEGVKAALSAYEFLLARP